MYGWSTPTPPRVNPKRERIGGVKEKQVTHTQTHDKNNTTHDHTKNHPSHLTTIEDGAATLLTASYHEKKNSSISPICFCPARAPFVSGLPG